MQFATLPRRYQRLHSRSLLLLLPTARPVYIVLSVADNRPATVNQSGSGVFAVVRQCLCRCYGSDTSNNTHSWLSDSVPDCCAGGDVCGAHEEHAMYLDS